MSQAAFALLQRPPAPAALRTHLCLGLVRLMPTVLPVRQTSTTRKVHVWAGLSGRSCVLGASWAHLALLSQGLLHLHPRLPPDGGMQTRLCEIHNALQKGAVQLLHWQLTAEHLQGYSYRSLIWAHRRFHPACEQQCPTIRVRTSALILAMESASSRHALRILNGLMLWCHAWSGARQLVALRIRCVRRRPCLQARRSLQDGLPCPARSRMSLTWPLPFHALIVSS